MIRYNEDKKKNEICLINIFKSIDGEGFHAGQPTVFVRTFKCNLRCGYCDTKECWNEENFNKVYEGKHKLLWMTVDEIIDKVEEMEQGFKYKSVCITGGEPLMEVNKEFMTELFSKLTAKSYAVNVETNGAVDYKYWKKYFPHPTILDNYGNRIGVSLITDWKLPHSRMNEKMIESNLEVLDNTDLIKCVISDDKEDWEEFEKICKSKTRAKIYLSPCFNEVTMSRIPEFVVAHPEYNISCQLQQHKIFWEPTKKDV